MDEKLSLLENSSDSEVEFKVNEKYANSYNVWRNKEELQRYKDLQKEDDESDSSSESEEDMPEFDEEFLRALSLLKSKDPRIYDKNFELFKNKEIVKKPKTVKQKPMYMKDYERNLVLERGGKFSDEDGDFQSKVITYNEEQDDLKMSFKEALTNSDEEEDDDDLLRVKTKTMEEEVDDEADYFKWLKGEEKEVSEDIKNNLSGLRNYWNKPDLDEGEKYVRDYILNKKHLEKDDSEIPSYEEITSGMLSDDEKLLEEQEIFEHKYNFRFEEPDEEFIKRYPRTVGDSLRKPDNRRKQKREEIAERKRKEKQQRREELKRLKALKRKEIEEKFMKLKEVSGRDEINLNESDIESDFDPDKHDQKMREMFNDDYYQVAEDQKPEFPFDEELDSENWNAWTGEKIVDDEDDKEDNEVEVDLHKNDQLCTQNKSLNSRAEFEKEMIAASQPKKKRVKKKSLFAKVISQKKPIYDPDGKSYEDYLDEYYKLDYEDVIGDMPVRYKYRKVVPNDFGLSVEEILGADDRELNKWCSVKKTCQYRNDDEEFYDIQAYKKKAQNQMVKKKIFFTLYAPKEIDNEAVDAVDEYRNKKKKHLSEEPSSLTNQDETVNEETDIVHGNFNGDMQQELDPSVSLDTSKLKKKSKKKKKKGKSENLLTSSECLHASYDVNINSVDTCDEDVAQKVNDTDSTPSSENKAKGKKKKRKQKNKQGPSRIEIESEHFIKEDADDYSAETASKLSNVTEISGGTKRKFEGKSFDLVSDSDTQSNTITEGIRKNKKKKSKHDSYLELSNSNETNLNSEFKGKSAGKGSAPVSYTDTELNLSLNCTPRRKLNESNHKNVPDINVTASSGHSNFTPGNSSEKPATKKKKKKTKKNKNTFNPANFNQTYNSQTHKFKEKKHMENASGDKRLVFSDERLAAYSVNPKKFKNKIIYSQK